MILKLYIKRKLLHLPRKQDDLTSMIKENFYKRKPLVKSGLTKLYRISDVENKNIKYEKNVNVFLVNLYLLVLEHDGELENDSSITITLSDQNILEELSKKTDKDLRSLSIEELEKIIENYISVNKESNQSDLVDKVSEEVEFSISWVKEMNEKLKK